MNTLEQAILKNSLAEVKELLTIEPNLIEAKDSNDVWLPYLAAKLGYEAIVRYIVEYSRASFNLCDENHCTMLHYATYSGNLSLIKYLVKKVGFSPLTPNNELITPFELSRELGFSEIENYYSEVVGCSLDNMYKNPIRTGVHPDPSIIRVGEDYYMVNSSFIYFPCIPISHSKDLINWEVIGHAITNPEWAGINELEGGRGYWAPDISYNEGRFYITATYRLNDGGRIYRRQMVTSSDRVEGGYCEPSFIDEDGIDPSIFTDEDGRRYMLLNRGARIFEISKDGTTKLSEASLLYYGDNKRAPEGPHLLKKDGYYYLFLAEGGTGLGHRISVMRSKTLMGDYESCPYNPIMRQLDESAPIQRCGHGKPVMTQNGEWYMVYLCGRMLDNSYSMLGRETALDPITWTADGWPIVNNLKGPSALQKRPNLPNTPFTSTLPAYNGEAELGKYWVSPRVPELNSYIIEESHLKIRGSKYDLNTTNARNLLLAPQAHFNFTVECEFIFNTLESEQDMGITAYYDENTYLKFGVFKKSDRYFIEVVQHIDTVTNTSLLAPLTTEASIQIKMVTKGLVREFWYKDNGSWLYLGTLDNVYYLCDEGLAKGKRFTGAMVGMYYYSNGLDNCYAKFKSFNYYL